MHISCQSQTPTGDNYKTVVLLRLSNKRISISCLIWRKNEPNNNGGIELCLEINQDGPFRRNFEFNDITCFQHFTY